MTAAVAVTGATDWRRRSDLRWGPWLILFAAALVVVLGIFSSDSGRWDMLTICGLLVASMIAGVGVAVSTRP